MQHSCIPNLKDYYIYPLSAFVRILYCHIRTGKSLLSINKRKCHYLGLTSMVCFFIENNQNLLYSFKLFFLYLKFYKNLTSNRQQISNIEFPYNNKDNLINTGVIAVYIMSKLIVETYRNSTVNTILDDISKKYKIDTTKDHLINDIPVEEIKFKYRTYSECIRMLHKSVGLSETKI